MSSVKKASQEEAPKRTIKIVRFWQAVYIGNAPTNFVLNPKVQDNGVSRLGNNIPDDIELMLVDGGIEVSSKSKKEVVFVSHANIGSIIFITE